jgi:hypothetical protein
VVSPAEVQAPSGAPGGQPVAQAPRQVTRPAVVARPAVTGGLDPFTLAQAMGSLGFAGLGVGLLLRRRPGQTA